MCFFVRLFPLTETDVNTSSELLFCLLLLDRNSYSRQEITLEKMVQGPQYNLLCVASYWLELLLFFPFSPGPFKLFEEINDISLQDKSKQDQCFPVCARDHISFHF